MSYLTTILAGAVWGVVGSMILLLAVFDIGPVWKDSVECRIAILEERPIDADCEEFLTPIPEKE